MNHTEREAKLHSVIMEATRRFKEEKAMLAARPRLAPGNLVWLSIGDRYAIRWLILDDPRFPCRIVPVDEFPSLDSLDFPIDASDPFGPLAVRLPFVVNVKPHQLADADLAGFVPDDVLVGLKIVMQLPMPRPVYGNSPEHTRWLDKLELMVRRMQRAASAA